MIFDCKLIKLFVREYRRKLEKSKNNTHTYIYIYLNYGIGTKGLLNGSLSKRTVHVYGGVAVAAALTEPANYYCTPN